MVKKRKKGISFQQFRSNVLQGLTVIPKKQQPFFGSKDDLERFVKESFKKTRRKK